MSNEIPPRVTSDSREEDDWEKDDVEAPADVLIKSNDGVPGATIRRDSSDASRADAPTRREESTLSAEGPLAGPRIRLMQRPKDAPVARDSPKAPVNGGNLWDDDEWDANRPGDMSNRKLWETANDPATAAMPIVPQNVPALPTSAALRILRRPSPTGHGSSPASSGASTPAGSKTSASSQSGSKGLKTLSEREEEYKRARERIFGLEGEGAEGAVESAEAEGSATAASSPNSLTKNLAAPDTPTLPKGSGSTASSVASSTSASSMGVPRRQVNPAPPLQNPSRSTSANSNARSNRGGKRNGRGESTFEPLRPPHEQMLYQQQQLHQQQQLYVQQQQYQMQMQLSGYAQSGYVGPGQMYGMNGPMMGMQQAPVYNPYSQPPYQPISTQGQMAGPSSPYASRPNPSMMSPGVVRQPAGPDDLGSLGFSDLRIRDNRYPAGPGNAGFGERANGARPTPMNPYSNLGQTPSFALPGRQDTSGQNASQNMTSPFAQASSAQYGARPTQQDTSAWPALGNGSNANGGATPSGTGRKNAQSVWRP